MRPKIFLTVLFFWISAQGAWAEPFDDANAAFKSGDFAKAAKQYESILKSDGPSAAIYYNLGNAYQRLGEFGSAILAYERAKLITPRDPDLRANLNRAQKAVPAYDAAEENRNTEAFLGYFSRDEWSWIVVGAAFVGAGIIFLAGCKRLERRWMRRMAVAGVCVSVLVIGIASTALVLRSGESELAVVVSKEAVIRLSPFNTAGSVGSPGAGRVVSLGKAEGDFRYVTVPDQGLSGWMAEGDFGAILPHEE